jgi:hypothetical protein
MLVGLYITAVGLIGMFLDLHAAELPNIFRMFADNEYVRLYGKQSSFAFGSMQVHSINGLDNSYDSITKRR